MNGSESITWLEESAWLQRLARHLVRDPGAADDAAQETLLALWRGRSSRSRRWLGSVLRNSLRQGHRARNRRADHEGRAVAHQVSSATDEVAARLEIQERVVQAVRGLDEPYRTTITLRFLEDLPPGEVARRMGVPVKTVHTRVDRALDKLRARLDDTCDGRSAWVAALAPLAHRRLVLGSSGMGVLVMSATTKWAVPLLGLVLVGWLARRSFVTAESVPSADGERARETAVLAVVEEEAVTLPDDTPVRRSAVVADEEPVEEVLDVAESFTGQVVDLERRPVSGIRVRCEPTTNVLSEPPVEERFTETGVDGVFELPVYAERGRLVAEGLGLATVIAPGFSGTLPPEPPVIVVAPARTYSGTVVDESGARLPGVELLVELPEQVASRHQLGWLAGIVPLARVETDADGLFRIDAVAFAEGARLRVAHEGHDVLELELPPLSAADLLLTLHRTLPLEAELAGHVLDASGAPVEGAHVSAGEETTRSDETGAFVIETIGAATHVRAVVRGKLPAVVEVAGLSAAERTALVLTIGAEALSISGRVVDASGEPVAGAHVWTMQGEPFGNMTARVGDIDLQVDLTVEEMIAGGVGRDGRDRRTDETGSFVLESLIERDYAVYAMHPTTLEITGLTVPAGAQRVELRFEGGERARRVAGRVTRSSGDPVEGALVRVSRTLPGLAGERVFRSADHDFHATTDSDGRFVFPSLCVDGTSLVLNGDHIPAAQSLRLDDVRDLEDVRFEVASLCHLRVKLAGDPGGVTSFKLLDSRDRELALTFMRGSVTFGATELGFDAGVSSLVQTDTSACTLVLYSNDEVVRRMPIELRAGEVNEIEL